MAWFKFNRALALPLIHLLSALTSRSPSCRTSRTVTLDRDLNPSQSSSKELQKTDGTHDTVPCITTNSFCLAYQTTVASNVASTFVGRVATLA